MACIEDRPSCGAADASATPDRLKQVVGWILSIGGLVGGAISVWKLVGGVAGFAGGFTGGVLIGFVVGIVLTGIIYFSGIDLCREPTAESECLAGVVTEVVDSFSSNWDVVLPWRADHDRVDLVVKSSYWQLVESGNATVFCTNEQIPRRSEIARCYFFDPQVCDAASGASLGAMVGAGGGIIAGAFIAAAMCVTIVLCILGLILAAVVVVAAVLVGAAVGGQIARANSTDQGPTTTTGLPLTIGSLVTVQGPMIRREMDDGANVIYWADSAQFHGNSMSPQPFSYCDINDELAMDGCSQGPIIE
jgi:hypothetical protein